MSEQSTPIADAVHTIGSDLDTGASDIASLRAFAHYVICKTNAIAHRLGGNIDRALIEEEGAETFYKRLPQEWRW